MMLERLYDAGTIVYDAGTIVHNAGTTVYDAGTTRIRFAFLLV